MGNSINYLPVPPIPIPFQSLLISYSNHSFSPHSNCCFTHAAVPDPFFDALKTCFVASPIPFICSSVILSFISSHLPFMHIFVYLALIFVLRYNPSFLFLLHCLFSIISFIFIPYSLLILSSFVIL